MLLQAKPRMHDLVKFYTPSAFSQRSDKGFSPFFLNEIRSTGAFVVFVNRRARETALAFQVATIIKSLFNKINYPRHMKKILEG